MKTGAWTFVSGSIHVGVRLLGSRLASFERNDLNGLLDRVFDSGRSRQ